MQRALGVVGLGLKHLACPEAPACLLDSPSLALALQGPTGALLASLGDSPTGRGP